MTMEWKEVLLGELVEIKHGFAFKGEYFSEEKTNDILLTPGNFAIGGGFQWGKLKFYDGPIPSDYILTEGDLVVTMTDLSKAGDTLGYSAIVPSSQKLLLHNQRIGKIKTKTSSVDEMYLSYQLRTKSYRNEVLASATGSTVKHTSPTKICAYRFLLPPLDEQKAIASVLSALDDKIENNRRMNETLEEMARAIFKSWFVDFDPVHAKAAGNAPAHMDADTAALFPSSFGDDGLPLGWEKKELGSLAQVLNGYAFKSSDYVKKGLFVLRTKNFGDAKSAERLADDVFLPEKFAENYQKYLCEPFDFHVVMVAASLGKTSYIFPHMLPALRNQNMWCFRPAKGFPFRFFLNLSIEDKITHVIGWGSGSARDFFKKADFVKHQITICENSILNQFEKTAASLYKKIAANHHQNETLAELRDTLLPKLMSGEIRVKDAESEMEAAV